MQNLAHYMHRFTSQINAEKDGCHQKQKSYPRRTDLGNEPVAHIVSMQASRIDEAVGKGSVKNETQQNGKPHHHDGTGHEPLPDAELVGTHQFHAHHRQEQYDEIGCHPETFIDQVFGNLCASCTGIVLDLVAGFQKFIRSMIVQNALVGRSCKEEGSEC